MSGPGHSANAPSRYFFRRASVSALGTVFDECPIENTRQRDVCRHCRCRVLFAECYTRQIFCWVFFRLCRVPMAHDKAIVSGNVYTFWDSYLFSPWHLTWGLTLKQKKESLVIVRYSHRGIDFERNLSYGLVWNIYFILLIQNPKYGISVTVALGP